MNPRRILISRLSHLGDVVCTLPLFHAVREAAPEAQLAWVVQPEFAGLLQALPGLDQVFNFDRSGGAGAWWKLRRELADFGAELAIDAQGNWKSAGVTWCSGAEHRLGLAREDWREPSGARVLTAQAAPLPTGERHVVQRTLALARFVASELGGDPDAAVPRFDPALKPDELARGEDLLDAYLPGAEGDSVVVHLAVRGDVRSWPEDYYHRLTELLLASGRRVLLLSGPAEKNLGFDLRHRLRSRPGLSHWIDQNNLREASGFFAACARRSVPMVASDSGCMHLAAANGVRVVTLEGPQAAERTGPWPLAPDSYHRILRALDSPDCAPCFARACKHPKGNVCMGNLSPALVAEECLSLTSS